MRENADLRGMLALPPWFEPISQILRPDPGAAKVLVLHSQSTLSPLLAQFLTPAEQLSTQRYLNQSDQLLAQVCRGLWRLGAGVLTSVHPAKVVHELDANDRPVIGQSRQDRGHQIDLNVSRSGSNCALIVSRAGRCGIDIEEITDDDIPLDVLKQVGFDDDYDQKNPIQRGLFYRRWTQIEASLTADGRGIGDGIEAAKPLPESVGGMVRLQVGPKSWCVHPIQTPDGVVGSCALRSEWMRVHQISRHQVESVLRSRTLCAHQEGFKP